jgi:transcriptional regulator with XRE-family HTH domain
MLSDMKTHAREQARALRRDEGLSVKAIAQSVGVSPSSVSRWVKDVQLSAEQQAILLARAYNGAAKGSSINSALRREARLLAQEDGRALARQGEPLHVAGCMLYWAEGSKSRNQIQFTNSDPDMTRFFVTFLRTYFNLRDEDIRITCNLFADHVAKQREIEQFWLTTLALPSESLCKSVVNVYSKYSKKKRTNRLPFGTCRVSVSRTRVVQSIFGSIQEYGGFQRDDWVDAPG